MTTDTLDASVPLAPSSTLRDLIAARAAALADAAAVAAPGRRSLSFAAMEELCASLAGQLRDLGVGLGHTVALVLPNGPEAATAFLAVAAVAVCAPLNPALKADELAYLLDDMDARAVVVAASADHPVRAVAEAQGRAVLELRPDGDRPAGWFSLAGHGGPAQAPDADPAPDAAALVLYTSGTTSHPKRVALSQANLCAGAGFTARAMGIRPGDLCLNLMPLYHAHGLTSTVLASVVGGGGVACAPGFDAGSFFPWLDECAPTWYSGVPAMHQAIVGLAGAHRDVIARNPLRVIRSASSPLPADLLEALEKTFGAPVIEAYGMTEATSLVSANPLPPAARKINSVGVSAGCDIAILDEAGRRLEPEEPGEIAIRGPNVFARYGNAPEANATAFTDGFFRTGDYGRLDRDGFLFIVGRVKEIINRGGSKLLPGEVDDVLRKHPALADAACFGLPHPTLGEDVAAAVVLVPGSLVSTAELQGFVRERLAEFKVPSRIFIVEGLPRTATGKVRRVELARAMAARREQDGRPADRGSERDLARLWAELLGVVPGARDNFFDMGGDSILLTRLHQRLNERFGGPSDVIALIDNPTVESQARLLFQSPPEPGEARGPQAVPAGRTERLLQRGAATRAARGRA